MADPLKAVEELKQDDHKMATSVHCHSVGLGEITTNSGEGCLDKTAPTPPTLSVLGENEPATTSGGVAECSGKEPTSSSTGEQQQTAMILPTPNDEIADYDTIGSALLSVVTAPQPGEEESIAPPTTTAPAPKQESIATPSATPPAQEEPTETPPAQEEPSIECYQPPLPDAAADEGFDPYDTIGGALLSIATTAPAGDKNGSC